ncbi:MAG: nitronate monooxygenase [Verrucomicrobia bacterium]|nr:nitronate monooxygenase [Verrucomicrobiota bacterium]
MLETRFCERFGVAAPIVVAPMGPDLTGPELVAAVSNAGGFGILQAQLCPPPLLADVARLFDETRKAFGAPDVLVNNAGVFKFGAFAETTEEVFHFHSLVSKIRF